MDAKEAYETCAAVADALPEGQREVFADLVDYLTGGRPNDSVRRRGARRWLREAGWSKR
jgi:hypothetical protein